jgi:metal-dependent amidase/aminoacylase/carboxypeptidase family protein
MSSVGKILGGYHALQADQEAFYKDLHQHPELSHAEHRTAERVAGRLQEYGFTVETGIGGTGVVGVLANDAGPTVLLRAELDGLPVRAALRRAADLNRDEIGSGCTPESTR